MPKAPSPRRVEREMAKVDRLQDELAERFDLDSIESETDALEILDQFIETILADEALVSLARERARRLQARADAHRETVLQIMEQKLRSETLERPLYTASLGHTRTVVITDEDALPVELFAMNPDKRKIMAALQTGPVTGAELSNQVPHLTLRTK